MTFYFFQNIVNIHFVLLKNTQLIRSAERHLGSYVFGRRDIYFNFFRPDIIPNFTFTRLASSLPSDAEIVEQYEIGKAADRSVVTILKSSILELMKPDARVNRASKNLSLYRQTGNKTKIQKPGSPKKPSIKMTKINPQTKHLLLKEEDMIQNLIESILPIFN